MNTVLSTIRAAYDRRTLLEQLMEELAELSQATSKLIRAEGLSNNPTDVTIQEAHRQFAEEWGDVQNILYVLEFASKPGSVVKLMRMASRAEGRNG